MMESAFGVEHGEIAKARNQEKLPRSTTAVKAGAASRKGYDKGKLRALKIVDQPLSVSGLGRATGRGVQHVGSATSKLGRLASSHGGTTGALVAGAGLGAGALGYHNARQASPKEKSKNVPKGM